MAFSEDSRVSDLLPSIHLTGQIDSSPPTNVLIVDPANGSTILSSPHLITGTAMDTLGGMASVMVQINDGPLQNAHLDTATTWSLADANLHAREKQARGAGLGHRRQRARGETDICYLLDEEHTDRAGGRRFAGNGQERPFQGLQLRTRLALAAGDGERGGGRTN